MIVLFTLLPENHAVALAAVCRYSATYLTRLRNRGRRALRGGRSLVGVQLINSEAIIALVSESRVAHRR